MIGADIGRSALSGDFNNLQYMNLVYINLMDMPFCLPMCECPCSIKHSSLFICTIYCCECILYSVGQILAATTNL